jgi:hypothetical protein
VNIAKNGGLSMNLRSFLYLNEDMLDSYLSAIDGGLHSHETRTVTSTNQTSADIGVDVKVFSTKGGVDKGGSEEIKKNVIINPSAKFDKLFNYLQANEQAKYYQLINNDIFDNLMRDDFIEILVKPRFSKIKELASVAKNISGIADFFYGYTDEKIVDKDTKTALDGITALSELKSSKAISCVFNFEDMKFPVITELDEQYFCVEQENFVKEVYVLCKIQRKLQKGEKVELDDIFEQFKNLPLNREQRRKITKKDLTNPKEIKDIIKGPAFTATVIAVYQ